MEEKEGKGKEERINKASERIRTKTVQWPVLNLIFGVLKNQNLEFFLPRCLPISRGYT